MYDEEISENWRKQNEMSEADRLFEELGYEATDKDRMEFIMHEMEDTFLITFWQNKTVSKCNDLWDVAGITMQELKAINMKVKELGWE